MACPPDTPKEDIDPYVRESLRPAALAEVIESSRHSIHVAEVGGAVVGFSVVDHMPADLENPAASGIPELRRCYVAKDHQGRGVAQRLIEQAISSAGRAIRLMVNDQNAKAISLRRRNGFDEVGEAPSSVARVSNGTSSSSVASN